MTSNEIKTKLLLDFRYRLNYDVVGTEVKPYKADVMAVKLSKEIVEVEVKCSRGDLKNDFKKQKHRKYFSSRAQYCPNRFYFAVPEKLADYAVELCKDYPSYGVIKVSDEPIIKEKNRKPKFTKTVKKAKRFREDYCSKLEKKVLRRMSSELVTLRVKREVVK